MRPIGGEFEISPSWLRPMRERGPRIPATGRGALYQILRHATRERGAARVALPDYICKSVIEATVHAGFVPCFYRVGDDLHADRAHLGTVLLGGACVVVLVSYFGLVDLADDLRFAREASPRAILVKDDVHAPFDAENLRGADYTFTSLRKALPVPDGAPVTPPVPLDLDEASCPPFTYPKLAGALAKYARQFELVEDSAFLALLAEGETQLSAGPAYRSAMSWVAESILPSIDRPAVALRRRQNFGALEAAILPLGLRPIVPLRDDAVPLFLPVRVRDRDRVRRELASQSIYCPAHWPRAEDQRSATASANRFYENELSLVIDQRYDAGDMQRIAEVLESARAEAASD